MLRLTLKRGAFGYFLITFDTSTIPFPDLLSNYNFQWSARRTLSQPTKDIFLDSTVVPNQFVIQSSSSVLLITQPSDTLNLMPGAYFWEFQLQLATGAVTSFLSPPTEYGDLILLERVT